MSHDDASAITGTTVYKFLNTLLTSSIQTRRPFVKQNQLRITK